MSLLMDALRKAEEAKRQAEEPAALPLANHPSTSSELELELELTEAYLDALEQEAGAAAEAERASPARISPFCAPEAVWTPSAEEPAPPSPAPEHQRWAARTVFVAKQGPARDHRRIAFYALVGALTLTTAAVYLFFYQASMEASSSLFVPPVAQAPEAVAIVEEKAPLLPTEEHAPREIPLRPVDRDREHLEAEMAAAARETSAPAIQITRRTVAPPTAPLVTDAYAAYQRGDLSAAQRSYGETLRADPHSRNALLGLAAVAARTGEQVQARELYLRLLDRDPNDPLALAGLLNLAQHRDLRAQESRVKTLLTQHPEAAHLHAALGNLYAREERWAEAQQAYANALALDARDALRPEEKNPDFAFNLAVSLEHLGRPDAALEHYRAALDRQWNPDFDPAVAQARVRALSGE